jgi:hypothetical protein
MAQRTEINLASLGTSDRKALVGQELACREDSDVYLLQADSDHREWPDELSNLGAIRKVGFL